DETIAAWLEVLERDAEHDRALVELARLYRTTDRNLDLLEVLERQVQLAKGQAQLALHVDIARLLAGPLARPIEALDRWAYVLGIEPLHTVALAAVEHALQDIDLRGAAADVLRPVYATTNQQDRLAQLALRQAEWTDDAASKLRALSEVVRLRE